MTVFINIASLNKLVKIPSTKNQIPGPDRISALGIYCHLLQDRNGQ